MLTLIKKTHKNNIGLEHGGLMIQCHTDTPYRQDPNLGEDKGGLLGPKQDKYKVGSLLENTHTPI